MGGEGAEGDLGFRGLFQDITTSASSTSEQISLILGDIQNSLIYSQIALANIYEKQNAFHHQERLVRSLGHTTLVDTILLLHRI